MSRTPIAKTVWPIPIIVFGDFNGLIGITAAVPPKTYWMFYGLCRARERYFSCCAVPVVCPSLNSDRRSELENTD